MAKDLRKLVVLEDSILVTMARDATFVSAFPFLTQLGRKPKAPSCCGGNQQVLDLFAETKRIFASMDDSKKQTLKTLLKAKQIRIVTRNSAGRVETRTF